MSKIALFGATGQIGGSILSALLDANFQVLQILTPGSESRAEPESSSLSTAVVDLACISRDDLSAILSGVETVISALNGKALEAQQLIQDAAWDAGVKRFYPSEFGMHHIYRKPGDTFGYIHPVWNIKSQTIEKCLLHPAITSGAMSYTLIGCGDFYNQPREKLWCPWAQPHLDEYRLPVVGNPDAPVDFTHIDDFAAFLVQTLLHPGVSENRSLNFVSDTLSYAQMAELLRRYSRRKVVTHVMPLEVVHRVVKDPANVPEELGYGPSSGKSAVPVDFWFLVRSVQGEGRFVRPPGEVSNELFPGVRVTRVEEYLAQVFGQS